MIQMPPPVRFQSRRPWMDYDNISWPSMRDWIDASEHDYFEYGLDDIPPPTLDDKLRIFRHISDFPRLYEFSSPGPVAPVDAHSAPMGKFEFTVRPRKDAKRILAQSTDPVMDLYREWGAANEPPEFREIRFKRGRFHTSVALVWSDGRVYRERFLNFQKKKDMDTVLDRVLEMAKEARHILSGGPESLQRRLMDRFEKGNGQ